MPSGKLVPKGTDSLIKGKKIEVHSGSEKLSRVETHFSLMTFLFTM